MNEMIRELDWDEEINAESSPFTLLPEGDYEFTCGKVERARFEGSEKMPPCKKAIVTFTIHGAEDSIEITENFLLNSKMEWKLSALFLAIGLKKHGEPLRMNWAAVPGAKGRCHVYVDKYKKRDGSDGESNKIKKFYAYDEDVTTVAPQASFTQPNYSQPASGGWKAGSF
jgi:hypothetical protein